MIDPQLHGWPLPLMLCVPRQSFKHRITIQDKTIEHKREVDIGDGPLTKQVLRVGRKQKLCD